MTTVVIIVLIVLCVGVVVAIVGHLGFGIAEDKAWRTHIRRFHVRRARQGQSTISTRRGRAQAREGISPERLGSPRDR